MLRFAAVGFLTFSLVVACGQAQALCTPQSEGFGDASTLTRTSILDVDRTTGACRPRIEVYRTPEDFKRLYDELELGDPPAIDFTREVVIAREGTGERGLRWAVLRNDVVTVGSQGCTGDVASRCLVEIFRVENRVPARGDEHACAPVSCNGVSSDPSGGD